MSALPESVGTLGAGNMAEAILRGLIAAGLRPDRLVASDPLEARRDLLSETLGIRTTAENAEVVESAELVVIAVKPQQLDAALAGLAGEAAPLYLSIVAGCRIARLRALLGDGARLVRGMPNTPALIGAGISAIAAESSLAPVDLDRAAAVLEAIGRVVRLPEAQLDAVTGLSGSGPAYVFALIEALTEAGVAQGLPAAIASELSTQTVLGAAQLVQASGEPPARLREKVSSPGGTTLAGLAALEEGGFRGALLAAVHAATERSKELAGGG
jgi:pyrroline-5-carboxylate reductase